VSGRKERQQLMPHVCDVQETMMSKSMSWGRQVSRKPNNLSTSAVICEVDSAPLRRKRGALALGVSTYKVPQ